MPTFFSVIQLVFSALLLHVIASQQKINLSKNAAHWRFLSFIFLFLAIDELAQIHERFTSLVHAVVKTTGYLHFSWVLPYGAAVLVLGAIFLPFLFRLPKSLRLGMILSGVLYVSGALGFELLEAKQDEVGGQHGVGYDLLVSTEETFEMAGILLFNYFLLGFLKNSQPDLSLRLK